MSVRAERVVPAKAANVEEVVINFDAESLKAPFLLRCGALLIDYMIFVSIPIVTLLVARMITPHDGAKLLNSELTNAGWLMALVVAVANFIVFPILSGQSLGKMLTGLQIVKTDGGTAGYSNLLVRHLVGYPLTALTVGLGFLFAALHPRGRALHDFLAGTIVVYGTRRRQK